MKFLSPLLLFIFSYIIGFSQSLTILDSLKYQLAHEREDTNRVLLMLKLEQAFEDNYINHSQADRVMPPIYIFTIFCLNPC